MTAIHVQTSNVLSRYGPV